MKRVGLMTVFSLCFWVGCLLGQEPQPSPKPEIFETETESAKLDKKFWVVSAALFGSVVFDTEATYSCIGKGACRERNAVMRKVFEAGRPTTYIFALGLTGVGWYSGYFLKRHQNQKLRRIWWVVPVTATAVHVFAGSNALVRFSSR